MWYLTLIFVLAPFEPPEIVRVEAMGRMECIEAGINIYDNVDGTAFACDGPNGERYTSEDYENGHT